MKPRGGLSALGPRKGSLPDWLKVKVETSKPINLNLPISLLHRLAHYEWR
jgi:hypothetical protein